MPVITRSQRKNSNIEEVKKHFVSNMNRLLEECDTAKGKENKMRVALEVYENVNKHLAELVEKYKSETWIGFTATVFNKTTDMLNDAKQGYWFGVDDALVKKFNTELHKSRTLCMSIIKNNPMSSSKICIVRAKEDIAKMENSRPRRSVLRVDYRDMDMMEPEF